MCLTRSFMNMDIDSSAAEVPPLTKESLNYTASQNSYVDVDIYGRCFDGIFGVDAEKEMRKALLLKQLEKRERNAAHIKSRFIDPDLYGRGHPLIFGNDSHIVNAQVAEHALLQNSQKHGRRNTSLRALLFPKQKLRRFLTFVSASSSEKSYKAISETSSPIQENITIPVLYPLDDAPQRARCEMPSQEQKPFVSPGTVARAKEGFDSDKVSDEFKAPFVSWKFKTRNRSSSMNSNSELLTSRADSDECESSSNKQSTSPEASNIGVSDNSSGTNPSSIENVETRYGKTGGEKRLILQDAELDSLRQQSSRNLSTSSTALGDFSTDASSGSILKSDTKSSGNRSHHVIAGKYQNSTQSSSSSSRKGHSASATSSQKYSSSSEMFKSSEKAGLADSAQNSSNSEEQSTAYKWLSSKNSSSSTNSKASSKVPIPSDTLQISRLKEPSTPSERCASKYISSSQEGKDSIARVRVDSFQGSKSSKKTSRTYEKSSSTGKSSSADSKTSSGVDFVRESFHASRTLRTSLARSEGSSSKNAEFPKNPSPSSTGSYPASSSRNSDLNSDSILKQNKSHASSSTSTQVSSKRIADLDRAQHQKSTSSHTAPPVNFAELSQSAVNLSQRSDSNSFLQQHRGIEELTEIRDGRERVQTYGSIEKEVYNVGSSGAHCGRGESIKSTEKISKQESCLKSANSKESSEPSSGSSENSESESNSVEENPIENSFSNEFERNLSSRTSSKNNLVKNDDTAPLRNHNDSINIEEGVTSIGAPQETLVLPSEDSSSSNPFPSSSSDRSGQGNNLVKNNGTTSPQRKTDSDDIEVGVSAIDPLPDGMVLESQSSSSSNSSPSSDRSEEGNNLVKNESTSPLPNNNERDDIEVGVSAIGAPQERLVIQSQGSSSSNSFSFPSSDGLEQGNQAESVPNNGYADTTSQADYNDSPRGKASKRSSENSGSSKFEELKSFPPFGSEETEYNTAHFTPDGITVRKSVLATESNRNSNSAASETQASNQLEADHQINIQNSTEESESSKKLSNSSKSTDSVRREGFRHMSAGEQHVDLPSSDAEQKESNSSSDASTTGKHNTASMSDSKNEAGANCVLVSDSCEGSPDVRNRFDGSDEYIAEEAIKDFDGEVDDSDDDIFKDALGSADSDGASVSDSDHSKAAASSSEVLTSSENPVITDSENMGSSEFDSQQSSSVLVASTDGSSANIMKASSALDIGNSSGEARSGNSSSKEVSRDGSGSAPASSGQVSTLKTTESSSYSQVYESTVVDEDDDDSSDIFLISSSNPSDENYIPGGGGETHI